MPFMVILSEATQREQYAATSFRVMEGRPSRPDPPFSLERWLNLPLVRSHRLKRKPILQHPKSGTSVPVALRLDTSCSPRFQRSLDVEDQRMTGNLWRKSGGDWGIRRAGEDEEAREIRKVGVAQYVITSTLRVENLGVNVFEETCSVR